MIVLLLLGACSSEDDTVRGIIVAGDTSAEVRAGSAWGVNAQGRAVVVISAVADTSCDAAVAYARTGSNEDNPGDLIPAGACAVYVEVPTGYEPAGTAVTDDSTRALVSVSCAMGEGEWVREERGEGDEDWFWSGDGWQGSPEAFTLALSGGDEAPLELSLRMDSYAGSFVYDTEHPEPDPAEGAVSLELSAGWCPGLASATAR